MLEAILIILLTSLLLFMLFCVSAHAQQVRRENDKNKELLRQAYVALARCGAKIQELESYKKANEIAQKLH